MRYLRSFLFQRVFVGVIGVALTVDLIVGDDLLTNVADVDSATVVV